ncbi:pilus assembly protein PilM [Nocardioides gansuensis]|uniref:Pilus assembly protein PilM n=1 Tax=Nocardioides gansuensis TaxID=2138300 RepID=A0A2T8F740_9ACTN|nr:type IV pilus assembly protein PilM [Nocardioides gansuensis]PVG81531.1 pilus assembly protein PilM [Nocardioides gansuensis]
MPPTVIGLDIGTSGIRAAEVAHGRRGPQLRRFAAATLPDGTVRAGEVVDPEALGVALKQLWSRGKFSSKQVALGLADDSVVVRQADLDWMPEADFRKALRYQVADVVPLPMDQTNLDHVLLDDFEAPREQGEGVRRVARILLVAAPQQLVDGLVRATESAGLRVVRADLAPLALARATGAGTGTEAVVDIGAETVTVAVHSSGRPQFVRFLQGLGGAHLTRALQEKFGWERADAERTKVAAGLLSSARHPDQPASIDHPAQYLLTDLAAELVEEIRATLAFSLDAHEDPAGQLDRVVLTGGGARLGGLPHLAEMVLSVPVVHLEEPGDLRARRGSRVDDLAELRSVLAVGLALGGAA